MKNLSRRNGLLRAIVFALGVTVVAPVAQGTSGHDLFANKQYEAALERFVADQVDNPQDVGLMLNIGATLYKLGRFQEAAQTFKQAAQTDDPKLKQQAEYDLGNALFREQAYKQAVESYEKAVAADPNDRDAQDNLAAAKAAVSQQPQDPNASQDPNQDARDKNDSSAPKSSEDAANDPQNEQADRKSKDTESEQKANEPDEKKGSHPKELEDKTNGEGQDKKSAEAPKEHEAGNDAANKAGADQAGQENDTRDTMSRDRALRLLDKLGETRTVRPKPAASRPPPGGKTW